MQGSAQGYAIQATRSDVEWLRAVSDWFRTEATSLEEQIPA